MAASGLVMVALHLFLAVMRLFLAAARCAAVVVNAAFVAFAFLHLFMAMCGGNEAVLAEVDAV
eukprot:1658138-Rhodomonas_salina.2